MNNLKPFTRLLVPAALAGLMMTGIAHAGGTSYKYAPVVSSEPIYETQRRPVDREVCWEEQHYERAGGGSRSHTPTVVGAIIGGVVGNQFGGGNGKRAATAAGAVLGGSIGRDVGRRNQGSERYYPVVEEHCEIQRDYRSERVVTGYRVHYEYDNRIYETRTRHEPGDMIRVRVAVTPVG